MSAEPRKPLALPNEPGLNSYNLQWGLFKVVLGFSTFSLVAISFPILLPAMLYEKPIPKANATLALEFTPTLSPTAQTNSSS